MKDELLADMGKRLSQRRKQLGITQEQLAEKMDVSIQMVSNMELGKKAIRPENLVKVCKILDVSSDYVLTGVKTDTELAETVKKISLLSARDVELIEIIVDYLSNR